MNPIGTPYPGKPPENCDICGRFLALEFIDGATRAYSWAHMCKRCHELCGHGLGTGRGQRYTRPTIADKFVKVEG